MFVLHSSIFRTTPTTVMEASPDQSKLIPLKLGKKEGKIHWLYVTYFSPNYRL
jgi:hypothetical protein